MIRDENLRVCVEGDFYGFFGACKKEIFGSEV